ncbi:formylglycine-generating enzyme required for sulfatase activity [Roseovarius sp. MBR-51]
MTTAAANRPSLFRTSLRFVALGLLLAAIAGVALTQRGPEPASAPIMAHQPVVFPDGHLLYVQRYEVTISEWSICVAQGACSLQIRARPGHDPAVTPATGLSYLDVQEYIAWINKVPGYSYRLPTIEEWNVMAASVLPKTTDPVFTDPSLTWASAYLTKGAAPRALKRQGSFSSSPEGIADLDGSVWEWTQDCYSGVSEVVDLDRCPAFFVGGEHVAAMSYLVRDPARGGCAVGSPPAHLGMRIVTDRPL